MVAQVNGIESPGPMPGFATMVNDTAKKVGGWVADHPLIVLGLGYLVVGYFVKPKWMPWSFFRD